MKRVRNLPPLTQLCVRNALAWHGLRGDPILATLQQGLRMQRVRMEAKSLTFRTLYDTAWNPFDTLTAGTVILYLTKA